MKESIHPTYGPVTIRCVCGNTFETRGTKAMIQVEICSACHPFFTGKQKLIDTAGRIDRFKKKYEGRVVLGTQKKQKRVEPPPAPVIKKAPEKAFAKLAKDKAPQKPAPKEKPPAKTQ